MAASQRRSVPVVRLKKNRRQQHKMVSNPVMLCDDTSTCISVIMSDITVAPWVQQQAGRRRRQLQ